MNVPQTNKVVHVQAGHLNSHFAASRSKTSPLLVGIEGSLCRRGGRKQRKSRVRNRKSLLKNLLTRLEDDCSKPSAGALTRRSDGDSRWVQSRS